MIREINSSVSEGHEGESVLLRLPLLASDAAAERERLVEELERIAPRPKHFKRPTERRFTRQERAGATVLFGGLTLRHERLIQAGLEGLGYQVDLIPTPNKTDFQSGKEYGNNGQCNPTYFTVGALVNYLKRLRDKEGMATEDILRKFVYITAGSCGPCRFGMYEAEYRLALRNSGFDGFRVLLFQQGGGLSQSSAQAGLALNLDFFLVVLNSFLIGDILNEVSYQIRPYETISGTTDRAFARCMEKIQDRFRTREYDRIQAGTLAKLLSRVSPVGGAADAAKFLDQLWGDAFVSVIRECAAIIDDEIEVDFTRPKPIVKITGEFWAQTTEGDGNFRMFPFLESQGAEVLVEPVITWINYMLAQARSAQFDNKGLSDDGRRVPAWNVLHKVREEVAFRKKVLRLGLAHRILNREYERVRVALGATAHKQLDQLELQRMGHPYYSRKASGGEGHLEVAKNIYYTNKALAHMVLSLKPFGCMPSTQSDGAQAAVISHFSDMIYIPVETSGEGDINAHSRVQMALGEAKAKCKHEFASCVARTGYTIEQIRDYVAKHRELRRPLQRVPHHHGIVAKAANFVLMVGKRMRADRIPASG